MRTAATMPITTVVTHVQQKYYLRQSEWQAAWALTLAGAVLWYAPNLFKEPIFAELAKIRPQSVWVIILLVLGIGRLVALGVNGSWKYSAVVRTLTAALSAYVWLEIVFGLLRSDRPTLGAAIYFTFIISDISSTYRSAVDAGWAFQKKPAV